MTPLSFFVLWHSQNSLNNRIVTTEGANPYARPKTTSEGAANFILSLSTYKLRLSSHGLRLSMYKLRLSL